MKPVEFSIDAMQDAVARLPDDRLAGSRDAALQHLRLHGMPTTRHEDWKYTDLSTVVDIGNRWLESKSSHAPSVDTQEVISRICNSIEADWLIILNGLIDARSIDTFSQAGVTVTRLTESDHDVLFDAPLGDLNTALLHDGLRIQICAEATLTRPIAMLVIDDVAAEASMSQTRIEIAVAANSIVNFVEYHASMGSADHYANSVVNLTLGDNSHVDYVRVQDRELHHNQTNRLAVTTGRDGEFNHCAFDLGGRLIRNDLTVDIVQPGGSSVFDGLYLVGDQQHIDNHTRVDHRVGPAESHQEYRGILTGRARGVWNGKAIVHVGADGTDAEQANHNLLLSEKAEIDAKPELEIYADDVKCSHGTTVGQLDEAALFYLRTRGLRKQEARQILTRAFAQTIVSKSPIASIHDMLAKKIATRLGELMHGADA